MNLPQVSIIPVAKHDYYPLLTVATSNPAPGTQTLRRSTDNAADVLLSLDRTILYRDELPDSLASVYIVPPEIDCTAVSTMTTAATVAIAGAPVTASASNATLTNAYALLIESGATRLQDLQVADGSALSFYDALSSHSVSLSAPVSLSASSQYLLPSSLPASSGYVLSSTTGGVLSWVANPSPADVSFLLTSDYGSTTSTTPADITGASFSVSAGVVYLLKIHVLYLSAVSTTGLAITLTYPAASYGSFACNLPANPDGTGGQFHGIINASGDVVTSTGTPLANSTVCATVFGVFKPSASGTMQLQYATEIAGSSVTVKAGTFGELRVIG